MLGKGRPFYFELVNPHNLKHSQLELTELGSSIQEKTQGKIGVRDLQVVTRDSTRVLKDSASTKSKSYTCRVKLGKPVPLAKIQELSGSENIALKQRNPTRVPRRADLIRDKMIEKIVIRPLQEVSSSSSNDQDQEGIQILEVDVQTSAGTYVKEFVHGDNGRTLPNLASLLDSDTAECLQLDVLEVHLDWPTAVTV